MNGIHRVLVSIGAYNIMLVCMSAYYYCIPAC